MTRFGVALPLSVPASWIQPDSHVTPPWTYHSGPGPATYLPTHYHGLLEQQLSLTTCLKDIILKPGHTMGIGHVLIGQWSRDVVGVEKKWKSGSWRRGGRTTTRRLLPRPMFSSRLRHAGFCGTTPDACRSRSTHSDR
ncbi:uncharacterized protein BDZ99DRAFT_307132 [Mytilinidion resinicola]|uniref:Uncharacterized protein n=1 Tax=Mytilinidion resinicola TaxID=574789 RepID=A0A6A6YQC7_9PEZI|nr:uncharacterized protein BDZ99DRAFT_307132 [Mytilinidion resinicola]KAF2810195.1 hypothetical protein BDZ99DRAFT_307132 [Mytilinidion resinicola]